MFECYPTSRSAIIKGDFPLNHDCILKVNYIEGSPLRFGYLTCCSQHSGALVDVISKLLLVKSVNISSVDKFEL